MNKNINIKEKFLCSLDTLFTFLITIFNLIVFLILIIYLSLLFEMRYDILGSILLFLLFILPLSWICFFLSKILISIFYKKNTDFDDFVITKEEVPIIYEYINKIRVQSKCPKIHKIAIDYSNNAHVMEEYKFRIKFFKKRKLVIGLPLLLILNERELETVIAHECAHISKLHSKSISKIIINKGLEKIY